MTSRKSITSYGGNGGGDVTRGHQAERTASDCNPVGAPEEFGRGKAPSGAALVSK
jgi:hypothetical protein